MDSNHITSQKGRIRACLCTLICQNSSTNDVKTQKIQMIEMTGANLDMIGVYKEMMLN